jgi:pSer/pThr/pTyr-binding forkhead associated (FHA) protein
MKLSPEDVQEYRFTVVRGGKPGQQVAFEGGVRDVRIGRGVDNEIVISDPTVSRLHARVELRADGWFLTDAGSAGGVEKMGFRISAREPLESGDEFKLGDTILRFEVVAKKGALKKAAAEPAPAAAGPPPPGLLHRMGLKTRRAQLLAIGAVAILGALLLWPSAATLPPQSTEPAGINYIANLGWIPGRDESHLAGATFEMPVEGQGLGIYFEEASTAGIEIRVENRVVAKLDPTSAWQGFLLLFVPRAFASSGKLHVQFVNLGYDPSEGNIDPSQAKFWGVRKMFLVRIPDASTSPDQLSEELLGARGLAEHIADNVGYRATVVQALRRSLLGVMKLSGKSSQLVPIPNPQKIPPGSAAERIETARVSLAAEKPEVALRELAGAIGKTDAELVREYQKLLNNMTLARQRNAWKDEILMLATVVRMLPDTTDPRRRAIMGDVKKLAGDRANYYNRMLEQLGAGVSG